MDVLMAYSPPSGWAGPGLLGLWFLILFRMWILHDEVHFAGVYDPMPAPAAVAEVWRLNPPRPIHLILLPSLGWLLLVGVLLLLRSRAILQVPEVLGLALVGLVAMGIYIARSKRPQLDVDEKRRELIWNSGSWLDDPLTLPFSAVNDARVGQNPNNPDLYHPEIEWRTAKGNTRTTSLTGSANRESVEAVVVRLRAALRLLVETVEPVPSGVKEEAVSRT
jgi:hypothetical protein